MKIWEIPAGVYDGMVRHVQEGYPEEACGLLFGAPAGDDGLLPAPREAVPMENIQNQMHERDPERFTRNARTAYYFDPLAFQETLDQKEEAGLAMRGIYHSHPDHDAYFSKKDREDAAPPGLGGPLFPGAVYVVFSVREARVVEAKGYLWSDDDEDFVELIISRAGEAPC